MARCEVCFRHCEIKEGKLGFCLARTVKDGKVVAANYGRLTGLALDPIEKKPLARFYPGSRILSVGSYGCNLRCPFCQNSEISWSEETKGFTDPASEYVRYVSPADLASLAERYTGMGNIGVAFTYNEPLVGYEYVRDSARLAHEKGMKNVLVSNGTASIPVLEDILPFIDAMNIDLKGFTEHYCNDVLGGDLNMVKAFIERAVKDCHVELTTLVVPGENDSEEEMRALSSWVASLTDKKGNRIGTEIPLHVSRFFPRFNMLDRPATDTSRVYRLAEVARENLRFVYTGNC
jgi:pyruvate formate lyase activating enzyme